MLVMGLRFFKGRTFYVRDGYNFCQEIGPNDGSPARPYTHEYNEDYA